MLNWFDNSLQWLQEHPDVLDSIYFAGILFMSFVTYLVVNKIISQTVRKLINKTSTKFDDIMLNPVLIRRISYLVPLIIIHEFTYLLPKMGTLTDKLIESLLILVFVLIIINIINSAVAAFESSEKFRQHPIKGYGQIISIMLFVAAVIVIIGVLTNTSPWSIITGLGAITAIIILVFRDTILSFVASIQISTYELVKLGDWIEVPKFGADGDVIDISLNVIKVQNWDKTITIIPTYKLIEESFKNWRGMQLSGGRRIKRAINIDVNSVQFLTEDSIKKFRKFLVLGEYLDNKLKEIEEFNTTRNIDLSDYINGRRLTNLGTFRAYLKEYLKKREDINKNMTFLVRHLEPGAYGLPIEIYIFANTTEWVEYEEIQANIFDHVLAVIPQFGLRVFQSPSGADLKNLTIPENIEDTDSPEIKNPES